MLPVWRVSFQPRGLPPAIALPPCGTRTLRAYTAAPTRSRWQLGSIARPMRKQMAIKGFKAVEREDAAGQGRGEFRRPPPSVFGATRRAGLRARARVGAERRPQGRPLRRVEAREQ